MKVLLDENLPHDLRHFLAMHQTITVAYMGWVGLENGNLLARAASEHFDAFVSKDAGIEYEQNLTNLPVAVVLLKAKSNAIDDIRPLVPRLLAVLDALQPRTLTRVE